MLTARSNPFWDEEKRPKITNYRDDSPFSESVTETILASMISLSWPAFHFSSRIAERKSITWQILPSTITRRVCWLTGKHYWRLG